MKWGLGMIGGACLALVLGMAVVAPTTSRGAGPVPTPSAADLPEAHAPGGTSLGRSPVEVRAEAPGPEQAQSLPPTPETETLDPNTALETSRARN